jgi:selenocysteine lyase/cysteine desulfurase
VAYDVEALRRNEFPWAAEGEGVYLNNASTGPLPQRTVRVLDEWARLRANPQRISHDLQFDMLARVRASVARLIGASPREIALATNTSHGLNLAAFSLPVRAGDVVLTPDREFPANVYPWMQAAARRGFVHRAIDCGDGPLTADRLAAELDDERVRVVSVSWVQFASGARVDLTSLGALCRERGVFFVVDAIQGLGPLALDVATTHVDVLACGAQKWLLSPWGTGFVYVRDALIDTLQPHDVSWLGVRGSDDFNRLVEYDLTWRDDARRFEFATVPFQDFAAMEASLAIFHELGASEISDRSLRLAERIVDWAADRPGVALAAPAKPGAHAAIVSLRVPDPEAASARLTAANVAHSLREGAIRLSPYFYNTQDEIDRALRLLVSS